jgi:hypothetical protein
VIAAAGDALLIKADQSWALLRSTSAAFPAGRRMRYQGMSGFLLFAQGQLDLVNGIHARVGSVAQIA